MIGTKIYKTDMSNYATYAQWANEHKARIVDKGEYFEICAVPLDEIKKNKIAMLKRQRDRLEVSPVEWNGNSFDYDDKARDRLSIARQSIEDDLIDSIIWTTADNTNVEITLDDFKGINSTAAARSNLLHIAYRDAKEAVLSAKTIEEVKAVSLNENSN